MPAVLTPILGYIVKRTRCVLFVYGSDTDWIHAYDLPFNVYHARNAQLGAQSGWCNCPVSIG